MDVDSVLTEAELKEYLGPQYRGGQASIIPSGWTDATPARVQALDDVMESLRRQVPPIREADLAQPSELKRAVKYGAEMWLLWHSMTTASPDSIFAFRYQEARKRFTAELSGLTPTVVGSQRGPNPSFSYSRR